MTITIQCESKNCIPLRFTETFSQRLRIFKQNFKRLLYVHPLILYFVLCAGLLQIAKVISR